MVTTIVACSYYGYSGRRRLRGARPAGFRPREPRSGPVHVLQTLPRWLLFVATVAALLLLGHAEPQLQLRSLSIFATGVLVALSPRLLRASYVVQSTVAERIRVQPWTVAAACGQRPFD